MKINTEPSVSARTKAPAILFQTARRFPGLRLRASRPRFSRGRTIITAASWTRVASHLVNRFCESRARTHYRWFHDSRFRASRPRFSRGRTIITAASWTRVATRLVNRFCESRARTHYRWVVLALTRR